MRTFLAHISYDLNCFGRDRGCVANRNRKRAGRARIRLGGRIFLLLAAVEQTPAVSTNY